MTNTYKGWANHETWLVNRWFVDDIHEPMTAEAIELMVTEAIDEALETTGIMAAFFRDMMCCAIIRWDELAEHTNDPERFAE